MAEHIIRHENPSGKKTAGAMSPQSSEGEPVSHAPDINRGRIYRLIAENITDFVIIVDSDWKVTYANDSMGRQNNQYAGEIISRPVEKLMTPQSFEKIKKAVKAAMEHPDGNKKNTLSSGTIEIESLRKDASSYICEARISILTDTDGKPEGFLCIGRDITDRKRMESAIVDSEDRYKRITRSITDYIYTVRFENGKPAGTVHGPGCFAVTGYTNEDFNSNRNLWIEMVHPLDRERVRGYFDGIKWKPAALAIEHRIIKKNGDERWVLNTPVFHFDDFGNMNSYDGVVQDITDRKLAQETEISEKTKIQEEMFKAQHFESLSQLAAGIAHDFNNLLGGIFGYIDIAREYSQTPEKSVEYIDKAIRSLDRAKDLSMRLLTFSRGGAPVKKLSSISELVSDAVSLSLAGKNVKAELRISPDIMQCDVDPMQMGRVFHNLIVNAQQSMPGGGVLYIAAVNTDVPEGSGLPLTPGRYVSICFKDQGPGIPEDIRKKIFDPFFTTKKQGSGLGLAICQSVLARHGGHIEVECPAGGGTEFTLYLPASGKPAISNVPAVFSTLSGSGKILVMDDEEYVLDFASQMLRQLGYTPVISQHSEETANKYRNALESGSPFRAVILDLTIPGDEGGVETVRRLSAIDPEVIAVASSGYSSDPVMAEPEKFGFKAVLKKPYMKKDLGRTLAALLNK